MRNAVRRLKDPRHSSICFPLQSSSYLNSRSSLQQSCRSVSHRHGPPGQHDPRLEDLGQVIEDEYAIVREKYTTPKNPVVLAHGLLGFNQLRPAGPYLPGIQYWRGIQEALSLKGVDVITAAVPPSGSIEQRARELERYIAIGAGGKGVNIIAGEIDAALKLRNMLLEDKYTDTII